MKAYRSVKEEMRETCIAVTAVAAARGASPARVSRGGVPEEDDTGTHIEPWMAAAFAGLTHASETGEPFALISCFNNGKPAALIAATRQQGNRTHVLPLFVAVDASMSFAPHLEDADTS